MPEGTVAMQPEVAEKEKVSLKGFRFFMPSTALTNAIIEQNQRLVLESVERNFPPGYQSGETDSQAEDGSLLGRLESEMLRSPSTLDPGRQTRMGKRLISERLYHYLSSLAETPRAIEGGEFPIWEYLPDGMATMLGLSAYRDMPRESQRATDIGKLVQRITGEFRDWLLEENGSFVTPWIKISLSGDSLRLSAIEEEAVPDVLSEKAAEVGQVYLGTVKRVVDFGAFVEIFPGTNGLLHITEVANHRVKEMRDELREGQQIKVKVVRRDGNRIALSRKSLLPDSEVSSENTASDRNLNTSLAQSAASEKY